MAEAVANVARRINATVEEGKDALDLSNCKLISFPDGVFKVLRSVSENIRVITLADNEMKALSSKFFSTFTQLRELDLQGNVLTKLPDAVGEMEHLTSINLANNSFSIFPDKLTEIATLERINLEGNSITGNNNILKHVVCVRERVVYLKLQFMLCSIFFFCRNSSGEVVRYAGTEVAKREVKPSGLKHSVCTAVSPQL
uniref:Leucine rich repeat containing 20 n=1 Tax=Lates calcarifer TaxID=8187 RepID=A0A4W6EZY9_LATCA